MRKLTACLMTFWIGVWPALAGDEAQAVPPGNWSKVASLTPGAGISVRLSSGDRLEGGFLGLTDDGIRLTMESRERLLPKKDVSEIRLPGIKDSRWNGTLIGMAAGAGLSGIPAAIRWGDNPESDAFGVVGIPACALIGALVGFLADNAHRGSELIYRAPGK